jgi:type I restriction enzyme S subunit
VIAHAKSAKFAKADVESQKSGTDFFNAEKQSSREAEAERGNVLTQRHKGTEDWPMVRLGDVCEVKAGATHHGIESANGKYPVYGSGGYICQATECRCPAGTVTVGRKGTLDKPLLIEEPFWNIDTCFGVIPGETIDSKFLWLFCLNFDFYNLVPSLGRPSTNSEAIKNIQIPLPSLSVQKEIVAKLDAAKERCEKLKAEAERGLRAAENLRKAILSEAFE